VNDVRQVCVGVRFIHQVVQTFQSFHDCCRKTIEFAPLIQLKKYQSLKMLNQIKM
jgi:hypothetical protein